MRKFVLLLVLALELIARPSQALQPAQLILLNGNQQSYLLDQLDVFSVAAYSVRQIRAGYTGPDMTIRRASDNATKNIGFVNGDFDSGAANAFCASTICFVVTWYDQSGSGAANATNATNATQIPLTVALAALNNRAALVPGDGSANLINVASSSQIDNIFAAGGYNVQVLSYTGTATARDRIWAKGTGGTQRLYSNAIISTLSPEFDQPASITGGTWASPSFGTGPISLALSYSSASLSNVPIITYNAIAQTLTSTTQPIGTITSDAGTTLTIGNDNSGIARGWPGGISEMIFFKSIPTAAQQHLIYSSEKTYFGTP